MKKHLMMLLMLSWTMPSMAAIRAKQKCVGVASYYSYKFANRLMASGCRYNPNGLTVANRWLPLGSKIRVVNLEDHSFVDVVVTDRGPWKKGRVLDLSYAAAKQLNMLRKGVAKVIYFTLPEPEPVALPDGI